MVRSRSWARRPWRWILPDPAGIRRALEAQRAAEQSFVDWARSSEKAPKGWPASLLMFHVGMWRERFRDAFQNVKEGKEHQRPPTRADELNDIELPTGIGTPLADAASRADHLLGEIMDLYESIGERPFEWYLARTTTEAVLRNSYMHPRLHMFEYFRENGLDEKGSRLFVDAAEEMRSAEAPALIMGAVLYNLAGVRLKDGKQDEALELLTEAFPLRPDLKNSATADSDLESLRDDPRFQELIKA